MSAAIRSAHTGATIFPGFRRLCAYHLVAKGKAPLTSRDVIHLGRLPDTELIPLLGWLAHRMSLAEAQKQVSASFNRRKELWE
jgi:hypothetical protein